MLGKNLRRTLIATEMSVSGELSVIDDTARRKRNEIARLGAAKRQAFFLLADSSQQLSSA